MHPAPAPRPRTTTLAIASAVLVLASPFLAVGLLFLAHLAAYRGTCGPYAPDIAAHACGLPTYAVNFFSPFALPAIVLLGLGALVVTATTVALAWGVARIARALRR